MVWPSFSAFQFVAGVTRELDGPEDAMLVDLPRIPTQHQEATLPADMIAELNAGSTQLAPLFIQYKRAEKLTRPHAREWQRLADRGFDLSDGYFRFTPTRGERTQHNKLVTLGDHQPLVFYAVPLFVSHDQYREYAANDALLQQTAFLQCGTLRQIDSEPQTIAVTQTESRGVVFPGPLSFPVRNGTAPRVTAADLEAGLTSLSTLREQFTRLRSIVERDTIDEQGRLTDYTTSDQSTPDGPLAWMVQQQRFFRESLNTDLLFFTDFDGD